MAIVVGVDGSEESIRALEWAVAESRLRRVPVRAVHAWRYPFVVSPADTYFAGYAADLPPADPDEPRRREEALLAHSVGRVDTTGVEVEQDLVEGHAAEVLLHAAEHADLLVLGSRGHGGFTGLLLGSVSQACAHHALCPVVIVRSGTGSS